MAAWPARVVRVVDGDTVELEVRLVARLAGVQAWELRGPERPRGLAALRFAVAWYGRATALLVELVGRERHGRELAIVVADGEVLNAELLEAGHARPWWPWAGGR